MYNLHTKARNIISKISFRKFFTSCFSNMELDDHIMYSNQKLTDMIKSSGVNKDSAVLKYLKDLKYPPVEDFKKGLEWFNVSEPLSFGTHLKGKVVVLDFFTYCCINCMHILPDLKELENEFSIEDGLVVIGVHSAKFANEKLSRNILAAVQRYNISHPVVNDDISDMWKKCEVHCWPTLVMLGPNANPIVMLMGEGHKDALRLYIKNALAFYKSKNEISNHKLPYKSAFHLLPELKGPLLFPGKIANFIDTERNEILAVSDTGNHRILILKNDGTIIKQVGGSRAGFNDGSFKEAEFNSPQGLVFQNKDILFVSDTENHAIRKINLSDNSVETIAGTGEQGDDSEGGKVGRLQALSSPWDLCIYKTCDLNVENGPEKQVLILAMAGNHQIWAVFLDDIVWWKSKKYTAGMCAAIAGNGHEENRNNQYPHAAAFAQPSGLALCKKNKEVYIADSESSSVRRLSLVDGKVTGVVGGDRNPKNLFAFGDKDGAQFEAKLQHLLGLALSEDENILYVADTYNHKLKKVDISKNNISTLSPPKASDAIDGKTVTFNEPAGLCVGTDRKVFLADTNNHCIKILELDNESNIKNIKKMELKLTSEETISFVDKSRYDILPSNTVVLDSSGGQLILQIQFFFMQGLKLTEDVPQEWFVDLPNSAWSCVPSSGNNLNNVDIVISVPKTGDKEILPVDVIFNLITCTDESCYPKNFIVRQLLQFSNKAPNKLENILNVKLDSETTQLSK